MTRAALLLLVLVGCHPRVTAPRGDCPRGQVLCPPNVGMAQVDAPSLVCTEPCHPGENFGPGIGHCDPSGCPRLYLP